jgi:hypothetical protein
MYVLDVYMTTYEAPFLQVTFEGELTLKSMRLCEKVGARENHIDRWRACRHCNALVKRNEPSRISLNVVAMTNQ